MTKEALSMDPYWFDDMVDVQELPAKTGKTLAQIRSPKKNKKNKKTEELKKIIAENIAKRKRREDAILGATYWSSGAFPDIRGSRGIAAERLDPAMKDMLNKRIKEIYGEKANAYMVLPHLMPDDLRTEFEDMYARQEQEAMDRQAALAELNAKK